MAASERIYSIRFLVPILQNPRWLMTAGN